MPRIYIGKKHKHTVFNIYRHQQCTWWSCETLTLSQLQPAFSFSPSVPCFWVHTHSCQAISDSAAPSCSELPADSIHLSAPPQHSPAPHGRVGPSAYVPAHSLTSLPDCSVCKPIASPAFCYSDSACMCFFALLDLPFVPGFVRFNCWPPGLTSACSSNPVSAPELFFFVVVRLGSRLPFCESLTLCCLSEGNYCTLHSAEFICQPVNSYTVKSSLTYQYMI